MMSIGLHCRLIGRQTDYFKTAVPLELILMTVNDPKRSLSADQQVWTLGMKY